MSDQLRANRLARETSPYLLQHAHNPVDWHPWGDEALEKAVAEDKPIFLSIGYSACHWCHVMERESFEDEETAALLNELFVPIKVDREERPDLDAVYMDAVQLMTGHGGWPMSVFLTPDGLPYYAGTYFPPKPRYGMPSFQQVLRAAAQAYRDRRGEVTQEASRVSALLQRSTELEPGERDLNPKLLEEAERRLRQQFDPANGGFGGAPKFPQAMVLDFLLRRARAGSEQARHMVDVTLEKMAQGGIYDQVGGGFHRYSVDATWLVPHFEKMLYDNAQLLRTYLHGWQLTGRALYRQVVEQTLAYVLREMTAPEGGFYSAQDADTEGEEGLYYLWTPEELRRALGEERAGIVAAFFGVSEPGNFEGRSILHVPRDVAEVAAELGLPEERVLAAVAESRPLLLAARERRVRPGRDEKVLTEWNGLMIHALAECGAALEDDRAVDAAVRAAEFVLGHMRQPGSRLLRSYKDGWAHIPAYLEDYASFARALIALYQATFDPRWVDEAVRLADTMISLFLDSEHGGFFQISTEHEELLARRKDVYDSAIPSGNSMSAELLLHLSALTGDPGYWEHAERTLALVSDVMAEQPTGFGRHLCALDLLLGPEMEIAIIGDPAGEGTRALLRQVRQRYLPNTILALKGPRQEESSVALLRGREPVEGKAVAYVCENYVCRAPVTEPEALASLL